MDDSNSPKKLSVLESFFQFKNDSLLTEEQKNLYSVVAIISSAILLVLSILGVVLGVLWLIIISIIFSKIVAIGLKSKKKLMSIIAIILYVINIVICLLSIFYVIENI